MVSIVTTLLAIAMIMGAVLALSEASLSLANRASLAWDDRAKRSGDFERTGLSLVAADMLGSSTSVDISIRNSGQIALRDFPDWDVHIRYYASSSNQALNIAWLPYTASSSPPTGQWTVEGLYINASSSDPEVFDPNLLNPEEEMVLRINITPQIPTRTDNLRFPRKNPF